MINVTCPSRYKINRKFIRKTGDDYFVKYNIPRHLTVNLVFVGKNKMLALSQKYKGENDALPILTFKYNQNIEKDILFGEIVICYPQAILLAAERQKNVDNIMSYLIGHGMENLVK